MDDCLLDRLRRVATEVDGPPQDVDIAARAALSVRRLGDELAELVADSDLLVGSGAVRDDGPRLRLLTFRTAAVSVELEIDEVAGRRSLRGQVCGAAGEVVVEAVPGTRRVPIDDRGWFAVGDLPLGAIRLRLRAADGTPVTTSWVS